MAFWRETRAVFPAGFSSAMGSALGEITDLLARLALDLKTLDPTAGDGREEEACDLPISKLNQSLNLRDGSPRVLDTALSLMCFKAPQVFDSVIDCELRTIIGILSSSVACKVLRFPKEEVFLVGSLISADDCVKLIETLADASTKLESHEVLRNLLSYAVVRASVLASCKSLTTSVPARSTSVSKLLCHLSSEFSIRNREIPSRLLLWYLDPQFLKQDVEKVMNELMARPFLYLYKEFHERMDWHYMVVCLALSPTMFIQSRALLHNWFLLTGLARVVALQTELVWLIMDIISRPCWWSIPMEVGSNLPFSCAYFPDLDQLLKIVAGPISSESFVHLVHFIKLPVSHDSIHSKPTNREVSTKIASLDYKSNWALVMNFPDWFLFASALLFSKQNFQDNHLKVILEDPIAEHLQEKKSRHLSTIAARYIAWILAPFDDSHQDLMVDCLNKSLGSWAVKVASDKRNLDRKKLKKPRTCGGRESIHKPCQTIISWLKEFNGIYMRCWKKIFNVSAASDARSFHRPSDNALFRSIPLGIIIDGASDIDEDECEVLLHYATTGVVSEANKFQNVESKHTTQQVEGHVDLVTHSEARDLKEAVEGACLVFNLTDIAERMSISMFDTKEKGLDFVCQLKTRTYRYLLSCVRKLLQRKIKEHEPMGTDLRNRLVRWRHQGREIFQSRTELDDTMNALDQ